MSSLSPQRAVVDPSDVHETLLGPAELASLWSLPFASLPDIERISSRWLAAPAIAFVDPNRPEALTIGVARRQDGTWAPVGLLYPQLRFPMWITAPMGRGKSVLLLNMVSRLLRANAGFMVMDCKASELIYQGVLPLVPLEREGDVQIITTGSITATGEDMRVALNLLWPSLRQRLGIGPDELVSVMINVLATIDPTLRQGAGMQQFAQMGLLALIHGESAPTLAHLVRFFSDETYRETICASLTDPSLVQIRDFWERRFPEMPSGQTGSLAAFERRLDRLLASPIVQPMVIAAGCSIDMRSAMDQRGIILMGVTSGSGEDTRVIVSLILQQLVLAALSRAVLPESERADWPLIVDEVQIIAEANEPIFATILSQFRSMRIGQCYVHQGLGQLPDSVLSALQDNAQNRVILGSEANDARKYASLYGAAQGITVGDFASLEVHPQHGYALHAYAKLAGTDLFSFRPPAPPPPPDDPPYPDVFVDWQQIRAPATNALDQELDHLIEFVRTLPLEQAVQRLLPLALDPDPNVFAAYCRRTAAHRAAQREFILANPGCIPSDTRIADPDARARDRKVRRITILSALRSALPRVETATMAAAIFHHARASAAGREPRSGRGRRSTKRTEME